MTLAATAQSKTYDGSTAVGNTGAYTASGVVAGESISATLVYADKNAGSNKTIVIGNAAGDANTSLANYNISYANNTASTITKAEVTLAATAQSKTYDGSTAVGNTGAYTASGVVAGESISATLVYADKNAGSNKTIVIGNAAGDANTSLANYNISYANNTASTITKALITGITNVTLSDKTYDGTTNASFDVSGANFAGKVTGDVLTLSGGTGAFANKNAGTAINVSVTGLVLGGADAGNYDVLGGTPRFTGTANITKANLVLTALTQSKTYDGSTAVGNAGAYTASGVVAGESISATLVYADKNAGSNKTIVIGNAAGDANTSLANYNISYANNTASTITKAEVTLTANSSSVSYNGATQSVSGFTLTSGTLYGADRTSFSALASGKNAGSYIHTVTGGNDNYNVRVQNGTLTITPASISSVSNISALNKIEDGTTTAKLNVTGAVFNGLFAGDHLTVASATADFENTTVGAHKVIHINGITLGGESAQNYRLSTTTSSSYADIEQKPVLYTASETKIKQAAILSVVNDTVFSRVVIVKPEGISDAARSYDYRSVAYSVKFEYFDSKNNFIAYRGTGINLR